jgi:hypothetical protein
MYIFPSTYIEIVMSFYCTFGTFQRERGTRNPYLLDTPSPIAVVDRKVSTSYKKNTSTPLEREHYRYQLTI